MRDEGIERLTSDEVQLGLQVARVGLGRVNYDDNTMVLDELTAELFEFPPDMAISRDAFHARIHPDDWPLVHREVDLLLAPEEPDVIDLTHRICREDGEIRWVNARKKVSFTTIDNVRIPATGVFAVVDVTDEQVAKEQTKILIGELNHRTKNLITVISGIARQLERHVAPEDFMDRLNDRLMALARNQDAISQRRVGAYDMESLVRSQISPFGDNVQGRLRTQGPVQPVGANAAQVLGMVLYELSTNAVKYGAMSVPEGAVEVTWHTEPVADMLELTWRETGGPAVQAPARTGFGSQVLTSLPRISLEAEVEVQYLQSGLQYRLRVPAKALD